MRSFASAALLLGLAGCLTPPSASQRLTDAALEMNSATRFGRMDLALAHVGPEARREFVQRHAAWGGRVRVVDLDFGGLDMPTRDEAEVLVNVMWQREDEATVRVTRVVQRWRDNRGTWQLIDEERKDGAVGLLEEQPRPTAATNKPAEPPPRVGFQRRVIRED